MNDKHVPNHEGRPGWTELRDGMADPRVGGDALAQRRQETIKAILVEMRCTHMRGEQCYHIDLIRDLANHQIETTRVVLVDAIRLLPRPLAMRDIEDLASQLRGVALLSQDGANEPRT